MRDCEKEEANAYFSRTTTAEPACVVMSMVMLLSGWGTRLDSHYELRALSGEGVQGM